MITDRLKNVVNCMSYFNINLFPPKTKSLLRKSYFSRIIQIGSKIQPCVLMLTFLRFKLQQNLGKSTCLCNF